jgi:hypothetical protein
MALQDVLASIGGDIWKSAKTLALWPWPAICIGFPHAKFDWIDYRNFCRAIRPGDMLLMTAERFFLSNRGISGTAFKHLAVYTGPCEGDQDEDGFISAVKPLHRSGAGRQTHDRTVVHAISEGVVCQDLGAVLFHEDYVALVRPWTNERERTTIVEEALGQLGKPYNFDFTAQGPPALYCTELGEFCCTRAGIIPPPRERRNVDWKGLFAPLDRYTAYVALADRFCLHFPVVAASKQTDNRRFWGKSAWADDLRRRLLECGSKT